MENIDHDVLILGQLWNLIDGKLVSKSNFWKSKNQWTFKPAEGSLVFVESSSKSEVLGIIDDAVIVEKLAQNNPGQMWEITNEGVANNDGYFTLTNSASRKVLTAVSAKNLEMKGIHLNK